MRMPGSGGGSHAYLAILIGLNVGFIAWIVTPSSACRTPEFVECAASYQGDCAGCIDHN